MSECKRREEWEVRSDLKGGNEQSLVEWWLAKGAIGLTGTLRLRVLGKNASGRVASCLLDEIHSRSALLHYRSALLHYKKKRESFPMQQNVVPFFPTCGALSPLTGHHLQHLRGRGAPQWHWAEPRWHLLIYRDLQHRTRRESPNLLHRERLFFLSLSSESGRTGHESSSLSTGAY